MPSFSTRSRAWFLRTFRGRSREDAGWDEESTWVSSPPDSYTLGRLEIAARPLGVKAAGSNPPSAVYEVRISLVGDSRSWSSRYGLPATDNSARQATEAALDEIDEVWCRPEVWRARVLEGMTEDEVEAMEESSSMGHDLEGASWIGPELDSVRAATRDRDGAWLGA